MAVNKVQVGDDVMIDTSGDTATPVDVASGVTFHSASGVQLTGTASFDVPTKLSELENDSGYVTASHTHTLDDITDLDDLPTGMDLLWSGEQALANTFSLSEAATGYKALMFVPGSNAGNVLILRPTSNRFAMFTGSENVKTMYFLLGSVSWNADKTETTLSYSLRLYRSDATTIGNTGLDPTIVAVYGMR